MMISFKKIKFSELEPPMLNISIHASFILVALCTF